MTTPRLSGKRALVTGGSRGIGASIVRKLADEGASVAINYVSDAASANALADELTTGGHYAIAVQADVSEPAQTQRLINQVVSEFGGLDLLASNAGVEHFGALDSITPDAFDRVFKINVAGQLFAAQAAAAVMGDGGRMTLTSSISARVAVHRHTLYAASKGAVSSMVLNLAPELAERGIAINAVAPGGTATDMASKYAAAYIHPALTALPENTAIASMNSIGRLAHPAEIAAVVAFLLSPEASYITGTTVDVAGGWI